MEVRSCLERIGPRMVFFTLYHYVIDSYVKPFALDTLPVRLSQRCGDDSPFPFVSCAVRRKGSVPVCFSKRAGIGLFSGRSSPAEGFPPPSGIIKMP